MPLGIRYSEFHGWSDMDRGYALAWTRYKRATCSGCGTREEDWALDEDAYISDHVTCEGCARIAEEQSNNLDRDGEGNPKPGQKVFLVPREAYHAQRAVTQDPPGPSDPMIRE